MRRNDRTAEDALERALDRLSSGDAGSGGDSSLAAAAQFHRQFLADPAATPSPNFLARLEEDLMHHTGTPAAPGHMLPANPRSVTAQRWRDTAPRRPRRIELPRQGWTELAAVAILLLTLVAGFATYRLLPGSSPGQHPTLPAAAPGGTPAVASSSTTAMPAASSPVAAMPTAVSSPPAGMQGCEIKPGSLDRLSLTGTPSVPASLPLPAGQVERAAVRGRPAVDADQLPADRGQPADSATVAGVTGTVHELVACVDATDAARASALFTDDYWRRQHQLPPSDPPALQPYLPATFAPLPPSPVVSDVRMLTDGRVDALLTPGTTEPGAATASTYETYVVFAKVGGQWLIDEAVPVRAFPVVQIVVNDDGFTPADVAIPARITTLSLRNEGTKTHSLAIPDASIRIEAAPGQVATATLKEPVGSYRFFSDIPGDQDAGLTGTLSIVRTGPQPTAAPGTTPMPIPATVPPVSYTVPLASVTIELHDMEYEPSEVAILANRDVAVTLRNTDPHLPATFTIDLLHINVSLRTYETKEITINAPAGVYAFHSTLLGQTQSGMIGTLVVLPEPAAPTP